MEATKTKECQMSLEKCARTRLFEKLTDKKPTKLNSVERSDNQTCKKCDITYPKSVKDHICAPVVLPSWTAGKIAVPKWANNKLSKLNIKLPPLPKLPDNTSEDTSSEEWVYSPPHNNKYLVTANKTVPNSEISEASMEDSFDSIPSLESFSDEFSEEELEWPDLEETNTKQHDQSIMNVRNQALKLEKDVEDVITNTNILVVEREALMAQLSMCEKRLAVLEESKDELLKELAIVQAEEKELVYQKDLAYVAEKRKAFEDNIIAELAIDLDDFSQAVQILLCANKYCDFPDLIRTHIHDMDDVYIIKEIKREIIAEAKQYKHYELMNSVKLTDAYLAPTTEDGLPELHDSYITDSYNIVKDN